MSELGFLKAHRLSSKKDIETLYTEGNSFTEFPFRFIWKAVNVDKFDIRIAISIPKKRFAHAVDRNLLKRRVRESFRKSYNVMIEEWQLKNIQIHLLVVYVDDIPRKQLEIDEKIHTGLKKITRHVQNL